LSCLAIKNTEMAETEKQFDTVIIGMGNTGLSCARFLSERKVHFAMVDSRRHPPMQATIEKDFPAVPIYTGGFNPALLCKADTLLLSPGVSLKEPAIINAIKAGVSVYGDIELFCQHNKSPVIAVTGSNGKSTVTTLVAEMIMSAKMSVGVGGNLGPPALDLLKEPEPDIYILELSSFQLETVTSLNAIAAVVLNVSEDHMDRYTNLDDYIDAKSRIFNGNGVMVLNLDDPRVTNMRREGRRIIGYTLSDPGQYDYGIRQHDGTQWLVHGEEKIIPANKVLLTGLHNISNALAAIALTDVLQLPRKSVNQVLMNFPGLPHRCQTVSEFNGVTWINDSKGTNVGATCAAIKGLAINKNIILIAGGDGKGADFSVLSEIAKQHLYAAIVIGRDGPKIKKILQHDIPVLDALDIDSAVAAAAKIARKEDIVLLSPACASFDMFDDYRARGDAFIQSVNKMVMHHG
jgi:UDP-N-acetylmuramoylalanine--D-glutamate ligase